MLWIAEKLNELNENNEIILQHIDILNILYNLSILMENGEYKYKKINYHELTKDPWPILNKILTPQTFDDLMPLALSLDISLDDINIFLVNQCTNVEYIIFYILYL